MIMQCERVWQKMSRAFFTPFGKRCHVFLPMILAKDVANISRQEVTLLSKLYLLSSPLTVWHNEAFAVQSLAVLHEWGMDPEDERVNPNGGAIAIGQPLGCSSVCVLPTLLHEMGRRPDVALGLATMCTGVGQGIAMLVEKLWASSNSSFRPDAARGLSWTDVRPLFCYCFACTKTLQFVHTSKAVRMAEMHRTVRSTVPGSGTYASAAA
jgi:Thiolase, C-terminal domain